MVAESDSCAVQVDSTSSIRHNCRVCNYICLNSGLLVLMLAAALCDKNG